MKQLDLHLIAAQLEGLEETIIMKLIDRAQFRVNAAAYQPGQSGFEGAERESLFDVRLRYQEEMDAHFGRFCVPEERPFTGNLPPPKRAVTLAPTCLAVDDYDCVNVSSRIAEAYFALLPRLCPDGDDGQYGSSVEHDVMALQAVARRVHYGALYVAESKYRGDPDRYRDRIASGDSEGILQLLTRRDVEDQICARVRAKAGHIQTQVNHDIRSIVNTEVIIQFYRDAVIPLTKQGEVQYLLHRKDVAA
ncbi:MAG: chorismate mutase [Chitinivibrionales bacterium]|nr:chorismate mutase [Chitinivibrionales bacterium]MBD3396393.1 chorismate mutase [Chitinivibrionales bacterium]